MLRPDNLDPDMLEEQSRKLLYFSHKDDIIVILKDEKTKSQFALIVVFLIKYESVQTVFLNSIIQFS